MKRKIISCFFIPNDVISKVILVVSLTLFFVQIVCGQSIDSTLVILVGEAKISNYELTKQYEQWAEKYSQKNGTQPQRSAIEKWKDQFLKTCYLLADSYHKGYDDSLFISNEVESFMRYNLTRRNGRFYKVLANEKVKISNQQWHEIYEKRDSLYYFEYIKFQDSTQLYNFIENPKSLAVTKGEAFQKIKDIACESKHIECRSDKQKWPFVNIWGVEQTLYEMKPNTYSGFVASESGVYLLHLEKKEYDEKKSIDYFMEYFPPYYEKVKSFWVMQLYLKQILNITEFNINKDNLKILLQLLYSQENKLRPKMNAFSSVLDNKIVNYTLDSEEIEITFEDFLKFYNDIFIKSPLDNKTTVEHYLEWMVQEEYMYRQAIHMGLTESTEYLLEKRHVQNGIMLKAYEKNEINIEPITEEELQVAYQNNREKFKYPNKIVLTKFTFKEQKVAFDAVQQLRDQKIDEDSIIETYGSLKEYVPNDTLFYEEKQQGKKIYDMILQSPDSIIGPVETEKGFQVYIRKDILDMKYAPIESVISYLRNQIQRKKSAEAIEQLIPKLKQKYVMEVFDLSL